MVVKFKYGSFGVDSSVSVVTLTSIDRGRVVGEKDGNWEVCKVLSAVGKFEEGVESIDMVTVTMLSSKLLELCGTDVITVVAIGSWVVRDGNEDWMAVVSSITGVSVDELGQICWVRNTWLKYWQKFSRT